MLGLKCLPAHCSFTIVYVFWYLVQSERLLCRGFHPKWFWPVSFEVQCIHQEQLRKWVYGSLRQQSLYFTFSGRKENSLHVCAALLNLKMYQEAFWNQQRVGSLTFKKLFLPSLLISFPNTPSLPPVLSALEMNSPVSCHSLYVRSYLLSVCFFLLIPSSKLALSMKSVLVDLFCGSFQFIFLSPFIVLLLLCCLPNYEWWIPQWAIFFATLFWNAPWLLMVLHKQLQYDLKEECILNWVHWAAVVLQNRSAVPHLARHFACGACPEVIQGCVYTNSTGVFDLKMLLFSHTLSNVDQSQFAQSTEQQHWNWLWWNTWDYF